MANNEFDKGIKFSFSESINYNEKAIVSKHLLKKSAGSISLFAFDKGEELSEHTAPFDATAIILDGECEITIAGKTKTLIEGQMIIMPANIPHALEATERFKMILIMIKN